MRKMKILAYTLVVTLLFAGTALARKHTTIIIIVNLTGSDLTLRNKETDGDWDESPAYMITNGATMSCKVISDKAFSGHDVELEYASSLGGSLWFEVRNTWGKGNHADQSNRGVPPMRDPETGVTTPLYFNRYGPPPHGDTVACTWILSWENLTRSEELPYDQINHKLHDSKRLLKEAGSHEAGSPE